MAKTTKIKRKRSTAKRTLSLPDPKFPGPHRPFNDPGRDEAWWWLGIPLFAGIFVVASYRLAPDWYHLWVAREGPGILETAQFILMVMGFVIAVQLLLNPFVRARPLVLAVSVLAALTCLYVGGEEVGWGQHLFFWKEPELTTALNPEGELGLHTINPAFEQVPRQILVFGVLIGGLIVPLVAAYDARLRISRIALFLPAAALVPTAAGVAFFKIWEVLTKHGMVGEFGKRPSETIEFYLYFFVFAYLIMFERRIAQLESSKTKRS
ncbi:MAG TPA: hypothetical protein VJK06_05560 [Methyloceanibacter sp.]|nr:hypothetical protein [Methyloceanibacter sp.]